jgi:hypothetical protein
MPFFGNFRDSGGAGAGGCFGGGGRAGSFVGGADISEIFLNRGRNFAWKSTAGSGGRFAFEFLPAEKSANKDFIASVVAVISLNME